MSIFNKGYGKGGYGEGGYGGGSLLPYYRSLVTSEYQTSPKFLTWLSAPLEVLDDLFALVLNLDYFCDLDHALGVQLDLIGQIVGASRVVPFQPSSGLSPVLDDPTYRLLLAARIAWNTWDGSLDSLQPLWQKLFPGGVLAVQDNQNMSIDVLCFGAFTPISHDLILNGLIVPRPEGVLINITFGTGPFFGFDRDDQYIAGFEKGLWA